jgi:hypothetical protein
MGNNLLPPNHKSPIQFKGSGAILTVHKNKIVISRHGILSFLTQGSKGDKEIYIKNITAIQLKKPGFTKGFIQFSLSGETASKGGSFDAVKDENSIMLADATQYNSFLNAKKLIEEYIEDITNPKKNEPQQIIPKEDTELDQIERLHNLKERGILTDEEFIHQKRKILGL